MTPFRLYFTECEATLKEKGSARKHVRSVRATEDAIYIRGVIANPSNPRRSMEVEFCVDTGAASTAIPTKIARSLGLKKFGETQIKLADGTVIKAFLAFAYIYIPEAGGVLTLVGYDGCEEPLLGFDIMSLLKLQIDLGRKSLLKPIRRLRFGKIIVNLDRKQSKYWKLKR